MGLAGHTLSVSGLIYKLPKLLAIALTLTAVALFFTPPGGAKAAPSSLATTARAVSLVRPVGVPGSTIGGARVRIIVNVPVGITAVVFTGKKTTRIFANRAFKKGLHILVIKGIAPGHHVLRLTARTQHRRIRIFALASKPSLPTPAAPVPVTLANSIAATSQAVDRDRQAVNSDEANVTDLKQGLSENPLAIVRLNEERMLTVAQHTLTRDETKLAADESKLQDEVDQLPPIPGTPAQILGVGPVPVFTGNQNADSVTYLAYRTEVRKARRKLALVYHPDKDKTGGIRARQVNISFTQLIADLEQAWQAQYPNTPLPT